MNVTLWPTEQPIPYAKNARKISDSAIEKVGASIREFGWRQPIVVDAEGVVIAGHTRLLAAKKLALAQVPVHVATELSAEQVRQYRLMDNRSHEEATWDLDLLGAEMLDLRSLGLDLNLTGFDEDELEAFLVDKTAGLTDEDQVPETSADPVTRPGDLWALGKHRLLCDNSTSRDAVARLLQQIQPHLMVTDPPYGVSYDPTWRDKAGGQFGDGKTKMRGKVANDDRADWREAWQLFPGDVAYVWHGALHAGLVADSLRSCGFEIRSQIIWRKQHFTLCRGDYHWQHEPCWYAIRNASHWAVGRDQATVWDIRSLNPAGHSMDAADKKLNHGTQKPVECMRRPIMNNSNPGQAVYEPFCGSGTTLIACEKEGRQCLALEIEPAYCDVIVERWQNFTGKKAGLEEDGRTFEQVKEDRLAVSV